MYDWTTYKLGDIAEIIKDSYNPNEDKDIRYIGLEHIEQQTLRLSGFGSSKNVTSNKFKFSSGDILFGKLRPYFRKLYRPRFEGVCSTDIWVIRSKNIADQGFLFYFLANPEFIDISSQGSTGTRMPRADWNNLKELEIDLPPLHIQHRIAEILGALDDKIELNHQINHTLEQMAQALYKRYFVDDIDPENLPEGWKLGTLNEIIRNYDSKRVPLSNMQRAKRKGIYPYYGATSIMDYVDDYLFDGDYILVAEDGSVQDNEGFPILQRVFGKFWVNNHAHILEAIEPFDNNYVYKLLQNTRVNHIVTGAVQPKINQANLNSIKIVIPAAYKVKEFQSLINNHLSLIRSNNEEIQTLSVCRDILLPKLISGEIIPADLQTIEQTL
jgi:type I restriction enzyme S subunit